MKASCKSCKVSRFKFELSSLIRFFAVLDVFRLLLFLGPMLVVLYGSLNLNPMFPPDRRFSRDVDYVLYKGNRTNMSEVEHNMLTNVEKICGKEYRNELPLIWTQARSLLVRAFSLLISAVVVPTVTGLIFIIFHKKERIACYLATIHFGADVLTIIIGAFGGWHLLDSRFCILGTFDTSFNVIGIVLSAVISCAAVYKVGCLYSFYLYVTNHCKNRPIQQYLPPTPSEELKTYLKELKEAGITPNVHIDLPADHSKVTWPLIQNQIKRALYDVRIQVAQLHQDDPYVSKLLASGKLSARHHSKLMMKNAEERLGSVSVASSATNMLKIAQRMTRESQEYNLLKQHQHDKRSMDTEEESSRDDVEIILPEPGSWSEQL